MRIAIDIDSTLHHYWDALSGAAKRRFGVDLPYEEQSTWEITRLKPRQLEVCIRETHSDERIAAAQPYDGAVEAIARWHEAGHFIHVTSHRHEGSHEATARWLAEIGLPYDELCCSTDKIARCREIGIDLLIDDSPVNLERAIDAGMRAATLLHPWNRDVCETEDIVFAQSWPDLEARLAPILRAAAPQRG
jgi:uncharacterized HAD superfamily protein